MTSQSMRRLCRNLVRSGAWLAAMLASVSASAQQGSAPTTLHDPELLETNQLQNPREATPFFPRDREKRPDWVDVLRSGLIQPRETLRGGPRPADAMGEAPRAGILFTNTREMPYVLFPHQPHTEWLACANCHDDLFTRHSTGRGQGMQAILGGKHCGACHGRVAFSPEGSCYRCHSQPNPNGLISTPPIDSVRATEEIDAPVEAEPRRRRNDPARQNSRVYPAKVQ